VTAVTTATQSVSTNREGAAFTGLRRKSGTLKSRLETILLRAAKGNVTARSARVLRNRSSIQEAGASPEAVCSKRNLSAQATSGRNRN